MTREHTSGAFWPTPSQHQLLVAALAEPEAAVRAWRLVQPQLDLEHLEPGSFELLPLVHRNLSSGGHDDALMPRLKGIYRRAWVKNHLLLERLKDTVEVLEGARIRSLVVEGPTTAARYYPDAGLRPTSFLQLLVDRESEQHALARLPRARWTLEPGGHTGGSHALSDGEGSGCVLRTSLAYDFVARNGQEYEPLWQGAQPQDAAGCTVLVPCPTDALLASCVMGARHTPARSIQWLADTAMIIRAGGIDWERLIDLGAERSQALRLRHALDYLSALPGVEVPREATTRLGSIGAPRRERFAYACAGASISRLGSLPEIVAEHLVVTSRESSLATITRFPDLLRNRWGLQHGRQVPLAAGRRAVRRLTGKGPA